MIRELILILRNQKLRLDISDRLLKFLVIIVTR
nr:MAG TPA: hypothetical protein [Caudoviricetes sp.]